MKALVKGISYQAGQLNTAQSVRHFTLQFDKGRVQGYDGCNFFEAKATVEPDTVAISTYSSMTIKACAADALQSAYYRDIVGKSTSWTVVADSLTLTTTGGDTFRYEPMPMG